MRKILISILIILLIIMAGLAIFKGISIGNFNILSISQIIEENSKLTNDIEDTKALMETEYQSKVESLNNSVSNMLKAKNEYLDLASISTKDEIEKATTVETYTVEFLWTVLGRHATENNVNLNYTPKSDNTISFNVVGSYTAIIKFVSAIENDSRLGFTIENFKLISSGESLQATFITRNVKVKSETTTSSITTQSTDTTNTNTNNNTNTETNTNSTTQNTNTVNNTAVDDE